MTNFNEDVVKKGFEIYNYVLSHPELTISKSLDYFLGEGFSINNCIKLYTALNYLFDQSRFTQINSKDDVIDITSYELARRIENYELYNKCKDFWHWLYCGKVSFCVDNVSVVEEKQVNDFHYRYIYLDGDNDDYTKMFLEINGVLYAPYNTEAYPADLSECRTYQWTTKDGDAEPVCSKEYYIDALYTLAEVNQKQSIAIDRLTEINEKNLVGNQGLIINSFTDYSISFIVESDNDGNQYMATYENDFDTNPYRITKNVVIYKGTNNQ